jgi:rubrerythrin
MQATNDLPGLLNYIINDHSIHACWLNTLSMLENAGARKIKQCEHPVFVREEILKHAAEESRHAWFLKKQLKKLGEGLCPTYEPDYLLAPRISSRYLHQLDISICRLLKKRFAFRGHELKYAAYLLVTYAIEVRADELYPVYQQALRRNKSTITVNNIIVEEQQHLASMEEQLQKLTPEWKSLCEIACREEGKLYNQWISTVEQSLS